MRYNMRPGEFNWDAQRSTREKLPLPVSLSNWGSRQKKKKRYLGTPSRLRNRSRYLETPTHFQFRPGTTISHPTTAQAARPSTLFCPVHLSAVCNMYRWDCRAFGVGGGRISPTPRSGYHHWTDAESPLLTASTHVIEQGGSATGTHASGHSKGR